MTLLEVRTWFVQESGRYELVTNTTAYADNGANRYLQAGQRMLDRMQQTSKSLARNFQIAAAGDYFVSFQDCRAITSVWAVKLGSDEERIKLEKKEIVELRTIYYNMNTVEPSVPIYYAPAVLRSSPLLSGTMLTNLAAVIAYLDVMFTDSDTYNGIVFLPPVDASYMIETWGYFYSEWPATDTVGSFWMDNHPELLVMAAQCVLEKFHRNSEGVKDWMLAIKSELDEIDSDLVEEETTEISQMGG